MRQALQVMAIVLVVVGAVYGVGTVAGHLLGSSLDATWAQRHW